MSEKLSPREIERYGRHLVLPEVGIEGQARLKAGSVLLVGAGGLGSPLGLYLAAAGVGRIGVVDFDVVDASNLQRQVLFGTADLGRRKTAAARERLADLNPEIEVEVHEARLSAANALDLVRRYDVVADGADNFPTRYLVNDACAFVGKPDVQASVFRFEGQASVFHAGRGPCYRCIYPEPPPPGEVPSCAEGGVLGVLPGVMGTVQATEVIKLLLGRGEPLIGRLLVYDALEMRFREIRIRRDPDCPLCGDRPTIRTLSDTPDACVAGAPGLVAEIEPTELRERLARGESPILLDVRTPREWSLARLPGAVHIPLADLVDRAGEIDPAREIVVYCKMGPRSARAALFLAERGHRVRNLRGGIDRWMREGGGEVESD